MTLSSHQRTIGKSQVYITPRWILQALGGFDLDPCAADPRPWDCAAANFTEATDGLSMPWHGRVWLNPPYDRRVVAAWVRRLADHGDGVALVHARTETEWFRYCWRGAAAMLFLAKRLNFCRPDGEPCAIVDKRRGTLNKSGTGAPPVLVAFGQRNARSLERAGIPGFFVERWVER